MDLIPFLPVQDDMSTQFRIKGHNDFKGLARRSAFFKTVNPAQKLSNSAAYANPFVLSYSFRFGKQCNCGRDARQAINNATCFTSFSKNRSLLFGIIAFHTEIWLRTIFCTAVKFYAESFSYSTRRQIDLSDAASFFISRHLVGSISKTSDSLVSTKDATVNSWIQLSPLPFRFVRLRLSSPSISPKFWIFFFLLLWTKRFEKSITWLDWISLVDWLCLTMLKLFCLLWDGTDSIPLGHTLDSLLFFCAERNKMRTDCAPLIADDVCSFDTELLYFSPARPFFFLLFSFCHPMAFVCEMSSTAKGWWWSAAHHPHPLCSFVLHRRSFIPPFFYFTLWAIISFFLLLPLLVLLYNPLRRGRTKWKGPRNQYKGSFNFVNLSRVMYVWLKWAAIFFVLFSGWSSYVFELAVKRRRRSPERKQTARNTVHLIQLGESRSLQFTLNVNALHMPSQRSHA